MKFIRIKRTAIENALDFSNADVIGWQIRYLDNPTSVTKLEFKEVLGSNMTNGNSYDFVLNDSSGNVQLCLIIDSSGSFSILNQNSVDLNELHSYLPFPAGSIGFDFCYLSKNELDYAMAYSDISHFHFSLMSIDFLSSTIGETYNMSDFTFKIECVKSLTLQGNGDGLVYQLLPTSSISVATPLVLIPMPCPPVWRPGHSSLPLFRTAEETTKKKYLKSVSKQIKSFGKKK